MEHSSRESTSRLLNHKIVAFPATRTIIITFEIAGTCQYAKHSIQTSECVSLKSILISPSDPSLGLDAR